MPDIPRLHTLHFNITNSCNLACSFCYINAVRTKDTDIPLVRIYDLAAEAKRVGGKKVILSGGEPFIRQDWLEICQAFAQHDFVISLVSNGTLIQKNTVKKLSTLPKLEILISLDGSSHTHDGLRGQVGVHDKTVTAIRYLLESGIDIQVNATIMKSNLCDVPYLTRLSRDLNLSVRLSLLHTDNGRGTSARSLLLDLDELIALRDFCHEVRMKGSRIFLNLPPLLQRPEDIIPIRSPFCGWTNSNCGVTHDGHVTICGVAGADETLYVGNIMTGKFDEIWLSAPLFNRLRRLNASDLTGICARCPVREVCGGACRLSAYRVSGEFTASYSICQAFYDQGYIPENVLDVLPQ